jgi:hypothetical protein
MRIGLQLERLSTCLPGQSEDHAAALLLDEEGGAAPAGRGGIQKLFSIKGVAVYWHPGNGCRQASWEAQAPSDTGAGSLAAATPVPPLAYVLHPTNCSIHSTLQLSAPTAAASGDSSSGGGMRVRAAAVVHHLRLSLDGQQAADMLALSDSLAWCTIRNKFAPYCPASWRQPGPRTVPWR